MNSRISDTYLLLLHPPSIRGKKRGCISRIVRTHNGWLVDETPIRRSPSTEYISRFVSSIGKKKDGDGKNKGRENSRVQIES